MGEGLMLNRNNGLWVKAGPKQWLVGEGRDCTFINVQWERSDNYNMRARLEKLVSWGAKLLE